ncbi:WXG100 family type VII secretion target [Streptomyces sp. NPDC059506]|uniref:ESAT-6-like protein n=1 Tax=Streptomyces thermolineatus TaxID=44033 RepID=A0ABN3N4A3_9ACTN|nr:MULTISPECIES: WXG100 family type VII secretion target [unclassified Streptomyces]MCZ2528278.1 WXG100 family type VII secretion target [Streptomyces sp. HB2AG]PLW65960.1 WXG100 family type VII secretion target [Streptomyces sp. DJ]QMV21167.1 WXG100 family type VII secretion target [Streptomyces sp. SCUT-3]QMV21516.1 WXG100 family type VII secretion target [Streptomyces sp. SCUT-3]
MSGQILVNFSTISTAANDVRQTASSIKNQLDDLEAGVKKIATTWEGSAQESYRAKQAEWDKRALSMQQTLEQIAKALDQAAQSYQATESRNKAMWG